MTEEKSHFDEIPLVQISREGEFKYILVQARLNRFLLSGYLPDNPDYHYHDDIYRRLEEEVEKFGSRDEIETSSMGTSKYDPKKGFESNYQDVDPWGHGTGRVEPELKLYPMVEGI